MANISTTDLPSPASTYTKTTQTVEEYTLKSGRVYKIEAWGAKGGNGGATFGGAGGNGSYAVGWYDMRTSADVTAQIFAGGLASDVGQNYFAGDAGWGATTLNSQFKGTPGGSSGNGVMLSGGGGGGGGASGACFETVALLVAGGGGGGGGGSTQSHKRGGAGGNSSGGSGTGLSGGPGGKGATQSAHGTGGGVGATIGKTGSVAGGGDGVYYNNHFGGGGGGAGGGYKQGFAGGGGGGVNVDTNGGGGGSGGSSYIGGVQSLKDTAGKASITWAHGNATGNGKVIITEYIMAVNVASPSSPDDDIYTVSAPSKTSALFGESYTFTVTREIGVGHIGLQLNTTNGTLLLTSTNGNVFTYTVSNVQGTISSADFSTTSYDVAKPPDGSGYTISDLSATSVLIGGLYSFTITFANGYTQAFVKLNTTNGKVSYSGIDMNTLTITISNVQGIISANDFTVSVFKVV